jgi:ABC-type bacteriocin/lantibiotic exporter with double-glycine peptidase domain
MIIAISILSVLLVITILVVMACIIHIIKIQEELKSISEEQSRQNEDIRNIMISHLNLIQALKDAAELNNINKTYNYNNNKIGEA